MKKVFALLLLPALARAAGPAPSSVVFSAEKTAAQAITEDVLRGHVRFLASDLLEGRAPASRGDLLAQQYVQAQMETLGLEPGAPVGGRSWAAPRWRSGHSASFRSRSWWRRARRIESAVLPSGQVASASSFTSSLIDCGGLGGWSCTSPRPGPSGCRCCRFWGEVRSLMRCRCE